MLARKRRKITKVAKSIKGVVQRTIRKNAETKHYNYSGASSSFSDGAFYASNCLYNLGNGTSGSTKIGDKILITGISCIIKTSNALNDREAVCYFALVESDIEQSNLFATASAASFISNSAVNTDLWRLDSERCKVLKAGKMKTRSIIASTSTKTKVNRMYKRMNKQFVYNPATGYGRNGNIYLLVWQSVVGGGLNFITNDVDVKVYFKDL